MRVLVACEYSGAVRDAFIAKGHDAWSCDILPTEVPGPHFQGDVLDVIANHGPWDMMIAFPPCTHLSAAGARHWPAKQADGRQQAALDFVRALMDAPIPRIAIENPTGRISTAIRKADQTIQPYQFGHDVAKRTQLWLKNLPLLQGTKFVPPEERRDFGGKTRKTSWILSMSPGPDRWKERSRTFSGIATAMADQWGAAQVDCACCENPWCNVHNRHAFECPCPGTDHEPAQEPLRFPLEVA